VSQRGNRKESTQSVLSPAHKALPLRWRWLRNPRGKVFTAVLVPGAMIPSIGWQSGSPPPCRPGSSWRSAASTPEKRRPVPEGPGAVSAASLHWSTRLPKGQPDKHTRRQRIRAFCELSIQHWSETGRLCPMADARMRRHRKSWPMRSPSRSPDAPLIRGVFRRAENNCR